MPTILLVEDHPRTREALRRIMCLEPDLVVVAEAEDGTEGLRKAVELRPDIVVCDLIMPGLNGFALTRKVRQACPQTRVVVVSNHLETAYIDEAMRCGASGYMDKLDCPAHLADAVQTVLQGHRYFSPSLQAI